MTTPFSDTRRIWVQTATRIAGPVLEALAHRKLKASMPVEAADPSSRAEVTHLEALGRVLTGLAPWLELGEDSSPEGVERAHVLTLAREAIDAATDPASADFLNFTTNRQPVVDAAFLAHALLRAPRELWQKLNERVRRQLVSALQSTRPIPLPENNWVLFASIIEAALLRFGEKPDADRLYTGIKMHEAWYLGDGVYGDGAEFHTDYYNSFVIQPMLIDVLTVVGKVGNWGEFRESVMIRAKRVLR